MLIKQGANISRTILLIKLHCKNFIVNKGNFFVFDKKFKTSSNNINTANV